MAEGTRMLQRRGTEAAWNASNYVLAPGEIGVAMDTNVIKIGDGTSTWSSLDPLFDGLYLPILGTASNSNLLGGISASGFVQSADATTAPTPDKVVKRLSDGRLQAIAGASGNDVVVFSQMGRTNVSRSISADATLALSDASRLIVVENPNYNPAIILTIPAHSVQAFPVGSSVELYSPNKGPVALTPAVGVTVTGSTVLYGNGSFARLIKINTDAWRVINVTLSPPPVVRRSIKAGADNTIPSSAQTKVRMDGTGTNFDSLGVDQQWSGADVYKVYARRSGYYRVGSQVTFIEGQGGRCFINVKVNGNDVGAGGGSVRLLNVSEMSAFYTGLLALNVGDYVEVLAFQDSGSNATLTSPAYSPSFFEMEWVRPL